MAHLQFGWETITGFILKPFNYYIINTFTSPVPISLQILGKLKYSPLTRSRVGRAQRWLLPSCLQLVSWSLVTQRRHRCCCPSTKSWTSAGFCRSTFLGYQGTISFPTLAQETIVASLHVSFCLTFFPYSFLA